MTTQKRLRPIRERFPELARGDEAVFRAIRDALKQPAEPEAQTDKPEKHKQ